MVSNRIHCSKQRCPTPEDLKSSPPSRELQPLVHLTQQHPAAWRCDRTLGSPEINKSWFPKTTADEQNERIMEHWNFQFESLYLQVLSLAFSWTLSITHYYSWEFWKCFFLFLRILKMILSIILSCSQSTVSHVWKQCIDMEPLFSSKQAHLCLADTSLSEFSPFQSKSILIPHSCAGILEY